MGVITWPDKDPDEVLDFKLNWGREALEEGDAIDTSTWIVPSGITKNSDAIGNDNTVTLVWLSGGTAGTTYELTNRITTTGGRTMDQSVLISVRNK